MISIYFISYERQYPPPEGLLPCSRGEKNSYSLVFGSKHELSLIGQQI